MYIQYLSLYILKKLFKKLITNIKATKYILYIIHNFHTYFFFHYPFLIISYYLTESEIILIPQK